MELWIPIDIICPYHKLRLSHFTAQHNAKQSRHTVIGGFWDIEWFSYGRYAVDRP